MEIGDLLSPESVIFQFKASSKKQTLQQLARLVAAQAGLQDRDVFEALLEREKLGSTGVGAGVAIPHARLEGAERMRGFFARLTPAIDFSSIDDRPVDLVFLLLAPAEAGAEHLKALARVSRMLRSEEMCTKLRGADSNEELFALLTGTRNEAAA